MQSKRVRPLPWIVFWLKDYRLISVSIHKVFSTTAVRLFPFPFIVSFLHGKLEKVLDPEAYFLLYLGCHIDFFLKLDNISFVM